ncbi:hypothetical protein N9B82_06400 [Saprospiraceae bacterium]|nr:hypothetical protein [Saprospiraceae bacterium]
MTKEEQYFLDVGNNVADSEKSQLFGKPCFKINGKAFCCFFQSEMVFKLMGEQHRDALSLDSAKLFDPSGKGRAMKEWVQVPYEYNDMWETFAKAALEYVGRK